MANQTSTRPTHRLYLVKGEGEAAHWTLIGAAWDHHDGRGYSLNLDAIPTNGRIAMREIADRETAEDLDRGQQ